MKKHFRMVVVLVIATSLCLLASCGVKAKKTTASNLTKTTTTQKITTTNKVTTNKVITTSTTKERSIERIEMATTPKTSYEQYQAIDLTNGTITVYYDNSESEIIPLTTEMLGSDANADALGEKQISITYNGFQTSYTINVDLRTLSGITATNYEGYYDGKNHGISLTGINETDVVTYKYGALKEYTETPLNAMFIGTYDVYYKVEREGYKPAEGKATISIKNIDIEGRWINPETSELLIFGRDNYCVNIVLGSVRIGVSQLEEDTYRLNLAVTSTAAGTLPEEKRNIYTSEITYDATTNTLTNDYGDTYYRLTETNLLEVGYYEAVNSVFAQVKEEYFEISQHYDHLYYTVVEANDTYYALASEYSDFEEIKYVLEVAKTTAGFTVTAPYSGYDFFAEEAKKLTFTKSSANSNLSGIYETADNRFLYVDTKNGEVEANDLSSSIQYISSTVIYLRGANVTIGKNADEKVTLTLGESVYVYRCAIKKATERTDYILKKEYRADDDYDIYNICVTPEKVFYYEKDSFFSSISCHYYFIDNNVIYARHSRSWVIIDLDYYVAIDYDSATEIEVGYEKVISTTGFDYYVYKFKVNTEDIYFQLYGSKTNVSLFNPGMDDLCSLADSLGYIGYSYTSNVNNTMMEFMRDDYTMYVPSGTDVYYIVINDGMAQNSLVTVSLQEETEKIGNCLLVPINGEMYSASEIRRNTNDIYYNLRGNGFDREMDYRGSHYISLDGNVILLVNANSKKAYIMSDTSEIEEFFIIPLYSGSTYDGRIYQSEYHTLKFADNGCMLFDYYYYYCYSVYYYNGSFVFMDEAQNAYVASYDSINDAFVFSEMKGFNKITNKVEAYAIDEENTIVFERAVSIFDIDVLYTEDEETGEITSAYWAEDGKIKTMSINNNFKIEQYDYVITKENSIVLIDKGNPVCEIYDYLGQLFVANEHGEEMVYQKSFLWKPLDANLVNHTFYTEDGLYLNVLNCGLIRIFDFNEAGYLANNTSMNVGFMDEGISKTEEGKYEYYGIEMFDWNSTSLESFNYKETTKITLEISENDTYFFLNDGIVYGYFILTDENGEFYLSGKIGYNEIYKAYLKEGTYYLYYYNVLPATAIEDVEGQLLIKNISEFNEMINDKIFVTLDENIVTKISLNAFGMAELESYMLIEDELAEQATIAFAMYNVFENEIVGMQMATGEEDGEDVKMMSFCLYYYDGLFYLGTAEGTINNISAFKRYVELNYTDTLKAGSYRAYDNDMVIIANVDERGYSTVYYVEIGGERDVYCSNGIAFGCNGGMYIQMPEKGGLFLHLGEEESLILPRPAVPVAKPTESNVKYGEVPIDDVYFNVIKMTYVEKDNATYIYNEEPSTNYFSLIGENSNWYINDEFAGYWAFLGSKDEGFVLIDVLSDVSPVISVFLPSAETNGAFFDGLATYTYVGMQNEGTADDTLNGVWICQDEYWNVILNIKNGKIQTLSGDYAPYYYNELTEISEDVFGSELYFALDYSFGCDICYYADTEEILIEGFFYKRIEDVAQSKINANVSSFLEIMNIVYSNYENEDMLYLIDDAIFEGTTQYSSVIKVNLDGEYDLLTSASFGHVYIFDENFNYLGTRYAEELISGEDGFINGILGPYMYYGANLRGFNGEVYIVFDYEYYGEIVFMRHGMWTSFLTYYSLQGIIDLEDVDNDFTVIEGQEGVQMLAYRDERSSVIYGIISSSFYETDISKAIMYINECLVDMVVDPFDIFHVGSESSFMVGMIIPDFMTRY